MEIYYCLFENRQQIFENEATYMKVTKLLLLVEGSCGGLILLETKVQSSSVRYDGSICGETKAQ